MPFPEDYSATMFPGYDSSVIIGGEEIEITPKNVYYREFRDVRFNHFIIKTQGKDILYKPGLAETEAMKAAGIPIQPAGEPDRPTEEFYMKCETKWLQTG